MNRTATPHAHRSRQTIGRQARVPLRAGPWSMEFFDGDLRNISLQRTQVVQRLCVLVRGPAWETLPRTIRSLEIDASDRSFTIVCDCESRWGEVDFRWRLRAEGSENGEIRYGFVGTAFSSFCATRIGICMLHSSDEFCGKTISVVTQNGAVERLVLPLEIAPWPIFTDAVSVAYKLDDLPDINLTLTGCLFEAEDQRNWGDASFKIYPRPLRLPHPYPVEKGSSLAQSSHLTLASPVRRQAHAPHKNVFRISILRGSRLPQIGVAFSSTRELRPEEVSLLSELKPAFLSVRYDSGDPQREALIGSAAHVAGNLGLPIEIRLAPTSEEWHSAERLLHETPVCRWLIDADSQLEAPAPTSLPGASRVYWGSEKGFVEINRNRWIGQRGQGVWFSLDPQVHASDCDSLIENLPAQAAIAANAHRLTDGAPVAISPIALGRSGADGVEVDPRHTSLFAAAWTVGSLKHLAEGGADSVAYFDAVGAGGVLPPSSKAAPGDSRELGRPAVYPVYHVLAAATEFHGGEALFTRSENPSQIEGIALRCGERIRLLLTNFSQQDRLVSLQADVRCEWTHKKYLDESNRLEAIENPAQWRASLPQKFGDPGDDAEVVIAPLGMLILDGNIGATAR